MRKTNIFAVLILFAALNVVSGCAGSSRTVSAETVSNPPVQTVVVEKETTHTAVAPRDYGILGGAFHVVGEVLAFPFEVIAGVFRFIF